MKTILQDNEIEEITLDDLTKTEDKAVIKIPYENVGRPENKTIPEEIREAIAIEAIAHPQEAVAEVYGTTQGNVTKYVNGKGLSEESMARVNAKKYDIADSAISKLMQSLELFDPANIEKPLDLVTAASKLSSVVEKIQGNSGKNQTNVQMIFYSPKQKDSSTYEVIEVG